MYLHILPSFIVSDMQTTARCFFARITPLLLYFLIFSHTAHAQIPGCTDAAASNYNAAATVNNGSCTYNNASISPKLNSNLNSAVNETSGLIWWQKKAWTHNDSGGDPAFYSINKTTGDRTKTIMLTNAINVDWEDIAQDDKYIYAGDFGNNANGNRTDLKIYRIKKSDTKNKTAVTASVIDFSYSDQTDFSATGSNHTNFDCEAMIAYGDSLFLFSKDWIDNKTRLYKLPKLPGTYTAENIDELNVNGLITGADIITGKKVIVLTGYDAAVKPFIYLLYDFTGNQFFDANKRKVSINQNFTQVEGVCAINDTTCYISNERLQKFITVPAKLQTIKLGAFLNPYYAALSSKHSSRLPLKVYAFKPVYSKDAGLRNK